MTITTGLIISRFVHYLALSILFGAALFPFYGFASPKGDPSLRLTWLRPLLFGAALLTLLSAMSWFGFATTGINASLFGILWDTNSGQVWLFRFLLAAILVLLLVGKRASAWRFQAVLTGSLILLASIALIGRSGSDEGAAGLQYRILNAIHLVASGVWVGALVVFAGLVTMSSGPLRDDDRETLHDALSRFSGIGTIAVATLTLSGILNPGFASSLKTVYGQVLLAKLVLFGLMLLLAAANRFWLTPRLAERADGVETAIYALKLSILTETALAVLVLLIVGWLGTLSMTSLQ